MSGLESPFKDSEVKLDVILPLKTQDKTENEGNNPNTLTISATVVSSRIFIWNLEDLAQLKNYIYEWENNEDKIDNQKEYEEFITNKITSLGGIDNAEIESPTLTNISTSCISPLNSPDRPNLIRVKRIQKLKDSADYPDDKSYISCNSVMRVDIPGNKFSTSQTLEPITPGRLNEMSLDELKNQNEKNETKGKIMKRLLFPNGRIKIIGPSLNEKFHGICRAYREDGTQKFEGSYVEGKIEGFGKKFNKIGDIEYIGSWLKGLPHGEGKVYNDNSIKYNGLWQNGKKHGEGEDYDPYGNLKYKGEFANNLYNGFGNTYYHDSRTVAFEGNFVDGKKEGEGKSYYSNAKLAYCGNYINDKINGFGKSCSEEGMNIYEGNWIDGKFSGSGVLYDPITNLKVYAGNFMEGRFSGFGKRFYERVQAIEWLNKSWINCKENNEDNKENLEDNQEVLEDNSGDNCKDDLFNLDVQTPPQYEGFFVNGLFEGQGKFYYPNRNAKYKGKFKKGLLDGHGTHYSKDGYFLYSGDYVQNQKTGIGICYSIVSKDDKLKSIKSYVGELKEGLYNGEGELYNYDEKLIYKGGFLAGTCHTEGQIYNKSGDVVYEGEFAFGKKNGKGTEYYNENKIVAYDGYFKNGGYHGEGKLYNKNSELKFEGNFINGKPEVNQEDENFNESEKLNENDFLDDFHNRTGFADVSIIAANNINDLKDNISDVNGILETLDNRNCDDGGPEENSVKNNDNEINDKANCKQKAKDDNLSMSIDSQQLEKALKKKQHLLPKIELTVTQLPVTKIDPIVKAIDNPFAVGAKTGSNKGVPMFGGNKKGGNEDKPGPPKSFLANLFAKKEKQENDKSIEPQKDNNNVTPVSAKKEDFWAKMKAKREETKQKDEEKKRAKTPNQQKGKGDELESPVKKPNIMDLFKPKKKD